MDRLHGTGSLVLPLESLNLDWVAELFDENHGAVRWLIAETIRRAHRCGRPVGLCGQAPSDDKAFLHFLLEQGIDAISFNADALIRGWLQVAAAERQQAPTGTRP